MKAWRMARLGDPWRELETSEIAPPQAAAGSVRIRVEAADLNFADILQCRGSYQVKRTPPFTPGMNAAGTVIAAGADAAFTPGTRLVGPTVEPAGGFAEQALLLARLAHPIPDGVSAASAMGLHITHGTAWLALHHRAKLQPGETVLVLAAAGGVGSAAVEMAARHGCWVIAAAGGPEKAKLAEALGADLAVDYNNDDLYERVMEATDGRGVDVVFDPVGGRYFGHRAPTRGVGGSPTRHRLRQRRYPDGTRQSSAGQELFGGRRPHGRLPRASAGPGDALLRRPAPATRCRGDLAPDQRNTRLRRVARWARPARWPENNRAHCVGPATLVSCHASSSASARPTGSVARRVPAGNGGPIAKGRNAATGDNLHASFHPGAPVRARAWNKGWRWSSPGALTRWPATAPPGAAPGDAGQRPALPGLASGLDHVNYVK